MATAFIFNRFRSINQFANRYTRTNYECWDANLHHGDIRPFACPVEVCSSAPTYQSIHPIKGCECLGFSHVSPLVKGFCHDQYFYVENGILRQATTSELCSGLSCRAGAPFDVSPPSASSSCSGCDGIAVSYVTTRVTSNAGILVESAPSPASNPVACSGATPNATVSWAAASSEFCIAFTRVYRVESTFQDGTDSVDIHGSEYALVAEFTGGGSGSFVDNLRSDETGGPLTTYMPMAFPAPDNLRWVTRTDDGIAVADAHRVYISINGQPQFRFDTVVDVEDEILAIEAIGNTILVLTDNRPVQITYSIQGDIASKQRVVINRHLPLKSLRSLSVHNSSVYFSSTYSLYSWNPGRYGENTGIPISPLLSPEQWKNIDPETVVGCCYEFGYIMSSDNIDYSLMFEFSGDRSDNNVPTMVMPISYINPTAFNTNIDGIIYYQQEGKTYSWDWRRDVCNDFDIHDNVRPNLCETCECCPWSLTIYVDNEGKNRLSKMRVEWDERSYTHIDVNFYHHNFGNQELIAGPLRVINSRGFSIPRFRSSQGFLVNLESCAIMHEFRLATSTQELTNSSNRFVQGESDE